MEHISSRTVFMLITVIYWTKKHAYYKDEHEDLLAVINDIIPDINADNQTHVLMSSPSCRKRHKKKSRE